MQQIITVHLLGYWSHKFLKYYKFKTSCCSDHRLEWTLKSNILFSELQAKMVSFSVGDDTKLPTKLTLSMEQQWTRFIWSKHVPSKVQCFQWLDVREVLIHHLISFTTQEVSLKMIWNQPLICYCTVNRRMTFGSLFHWWMGYAMSNLV